jgi:hypothetical protein
MYNNQPIFLIAVQERKTMPELMGYISENTKQLKEYLASYFNRMQDMKKMIESDAYVQAMVFLTMLYGYFSSNALWGDRFINVANKEFIQNSVRSFCNGIKR